MFLAQCKRLLPSLADRSRQEFEVASVCSVIGILSHSAVVEEARAEEGGFWIIIFGEIEPARRGELEICVAHPGVIFVCRARGKNRQTSITACSWLPADRILKPQGRSCLIILGAIQRACCLRHQDLGIETKSYKDLTGIALAFLYCPGGGLRDLSYLFAVELLAGVAFLGVTLSASAGEWAVCYSSECSPTRLGTYDVVVLDPQAHPPLSRVKQRGASLFGYLSIGEIESYRPYFEWAREAGLIVRENPNWSDNYLVDVRRDVWLEKLVYEIVPRLIREGFDGLMLDTADSALQLENEQPKKFSGMEAATVKIVRTLAHHYPDTDLILNRGYPILPKVGNVVDYVLGESVYTDYDFETEAYRRRSASDHRHQTRILKQAMEAHPGLQVLTLDYWSADEPAVIREIYRVERNHGFWPYVATIDLQQVIPEPKE